MIPRLRLCVGGLRDYVVGLGGMGWVNCMGPELWGLGLHTGSSCDGRGVLLCFGFFFAVNLWVRFLIVASSDYVLAVVMGNCC